MDRLRVGLVGGGPWARTVHAPGLAAHAGTELAAVWTRRPQAASELAAEFGARAYTDLEVLFDAVDAVAFAVPPQAQGRLALFAAAAGKHLICEKPLAGTVEDARAVVDAVERAGVRSTMVLTMRHAPSVRDWLAEMPAEPAGADTVAFARWISGSLLGGPYSASPWRADEGALSDLGPHVIDLLDAALGPVVDVPWARYEEPDFWRFGLLHTGGAQSTVTLSMRVPVDPSEIEFTVFGGAGRHRLAGRGADAPTCYAALLDELVAAVDGSGPPPALDVTRGLRVQELVEAVRIAVA
ncbi:putative dehydrogenase [Pseudonocardia hierapolitana]|uniref:Putative dehydrogenase n=1 Tax=Pseudonocardia hierapolitana TaxID=1128676 RepID=A0A561SSD6_9PSEU|nr:Gfo/Idh/MocA family oxidoreductase [Pseudonocardia hierapolitana]TWF77745.1 putative dehydrogenase [Pseudonocardia hierapolitana]